MLERAGVRLRPEDKANITIIAEAIKAQGGTQKRPWQTSATVTDCVRLALKTTAHLMQRAAEPPAT